ncbi:hypothetical protein [Solibacillus sp. CAU 1738]|uniref:tetratricopeptide repeat protein n=1 Tax=Solibacillus sp. CAU 1738 TaxID=3140363 RepID=UPI0032607B0D
MPAKQNISQYVEAASRQFTDRQTPRAAFAAAINDVSKTKILTYYGLGGIGKTRLLKYLEDQTQPNTNFVTLFVDFQESAFRTVVEMMNTLKFQLLKTEKIDFFAFDMAFAMYWAKTQSTNQPVQMSKSFVHEGHILYDIVADLEQVTFSSWVPKAINLMSKIPSHTKKSIWWMKTGQELVQQLNTLDVQQLRDALITLWVDDVSRHFKEQRKSLIMFFDCYEVLDSYMVQRLKAFAQNHQDFPTLFVIGSRDKLAWESTSAYEVEEHLVGELSSNDVDNFLQSCGIKCLGEDCDCVKSGMDVSECEHNHQLIREKIAKTTNGIPFYLDLMVDTYLQVKLIEMPTPAHFSDNIDFVLQRLLQNFNAEDLATLKLLSFPNYWNYEVAKLLLRDFYAGVPLSDLHKFDYLSIIEESTEGHSTMNKMMRQWLQSDAEQKSIHYYNDVHYTLFTYYTNILDNSFSKEALLEATYHGQITLEQKEFETWLQQMISKMSVLGQWQETIAIIESNLTLGRFSPHFVVSMYEELFKCYLHLGLYDSIKEKLNAAIVCANEVADKQSIARFYFTMASAYYALSEYEQAIKHFQMSIEYAGQTEQTIEAYVKIGKISITIGDLELARQSYLKASQLTNQFLQTLPNDVMLNSLAGQCYEKLGELMGDYYDKRKEQLRLYKQSIFHLDRTLMDKEHPSYLTHLTLKGFSVKRLAEAYRHHQGDVIGTFKEAIGTYELVIQSAPFYVDVQEKLGHAAVELLIECIEKQQFDELEMIYSKAVKAFETVLEVAPKQGSSLNRLSSAHLEMAKVYLKNDKLSSAKVLLDEALKWNGETVNRAPKYAYAQKKTKAIYENYALYYHAIGENEEAEHFAKKAAAI